MSDLPIGFCLQCEQSREEVKTHQTICGIEDGYEYRELVAEWPRHHWRDWSDTELKAAGIKPAFFDEYRRRSASRLHYAACDHFERGHDFPSVDVYFDECLIEPKDICRRCSAKKDQEDERVHES